MASQRREFKIGIIGCGRISQSYAQAMTACEGVKLAAVMDVRPEAAATAAEAAGARAFTDVETFIEESGVEGAIICAPPIDHRPLALQLLDAGIHVLCEKPFATNSEDARAMIERAEERDRVIMMASKFRYVEDVIRAKAILASGLLGDVLFYENKFTGKVNMRGRWNSDPKVAGGGVLIDNGTHSVDIARYLFGPIKRVYAQECRRVAGLPVEDTASLSFVTESGVTGNIFLSWNINISQGGYINIYGTDGTLSIGWQESKHQHNGHPNWIPFGVGYDKVAAFKNQVMNFVETVRGSASPIITVQDGLASVEVIEAAYRSMATQSWCVMEEASSEPRLAAAL